ncbi:sigma-70 family RNA polymerase sigma factor [Microbacterium sp. CR_7]|uniref:sigma-70 family RNA polymerase sigma factor n=1 Tax=Microbacterium sp. CR_7 TaxID=3055792 RepID=UPI0035C13637
MTTTPGELRRTRDSDSLGSADQPAAALAPEELPVAAAAGDRVAAGQLLANHLPALSALARRFSGPAYEAEDLLGDAIVSVLSQWAAGKGPTENVVAYMAQIMRNRVNDAVKSPRSKVVLLSDDDDVAAPEDPRIEQIDVGAELALVRRALDELPEDQRVVLRATVLEGRKPAELEATLHRPASAIYSLSARARANLRRTTLRLVLEVNARPDCSAAAQRLPERVGDTPDSTSTGRSADHFATCRRCRRAWGRFGALSALGLVPLVIVAWEVAGPAPAAVADSGPDDGADRSTPELDAPRATRRVLFKRLLIGGSALLAVGAVVLVIVLTTFTTRTLWFAPLEGGYLTVGAEGESTVTQLDVSFNLDGGAWTVRELRIDIDNEIVGIHAPDTWDCTLAGDLAICVTSAPSPQGGLFIVTHSASEGVVYDVSIDAETANGARVSGDASGRVNSAGT